MTTHVTLEESARQALQSHWERLVQERQLDESASHAASPTECPLLWRVPDFVSLIAQEHDRPIGELEPIVRRLIDEADFVDENGDTMIGTATHDQEVDEQAKLVIAVLEELCAEAVGRGYWSDAPVTPIMFG